MSRWRKDPLEVCGERHTNATLAYHECICQFDHSRQKKYRQALRYKHCQLADEMRRIDNFELYVIIAIVIGVVLIFSIAAFCSCKWYIQTNDNPCGCCPCGPCKKKKKRKKKTEMEEREGGDGESADSHGFENGSQAWTPIRLGAPPPTVTQTPAPSAPASSASPPQEHRRRKGRGLCMKFCLSDPVQDCCEFFDCDLLWRKKSIYTIPVFGRRKPPPLQRRPTRPAPPPPKPSAPVEVKYPEPVHVGFEDLECEPVPEAPPSPEPLRMDQPRAMYVDPLAFLQRPFLKATKEKSSEEEPEALYSKMKGFVFGRGKKSGSLASLSQIGVSKNPAPDATSTTSSRKSKYSHTGSLASLNNLSEDQLSASYNTKRSMSLASLHAVEEVKTGPGRGAGRGLLVARSRGSLHNIAEDDIPPSLRTDEYIDLEEMSKRIEAKMQAARAAESNNASTEPATHPSIPVTSTSRTPDFIPASSYTKSAQPDASVAALPQNQQTRYPQHTPHPPQPQYPPPHSQYSPRPQYSPRAQYSPRPQYSPQPPSSPRPQYTPQPQYTPRHHYTPQPQYSPGIQYSPQPPQYPVGAGYDGESQHMGGEGSNPKYYPAVPATPEKPAVPARIAVGTPVVGTLGRPKPLVPPRPGSNSPKPRAPQPPTGTQGRGGLVVKPSAPPPPPPVNAPIESAL